MVSKSVIEITKYKKNINNYTQMANPKFIILFELMAYTKTNIKMLSF